MAQAKKAESPLREAILAEARTLLVRHGLKDFSLRRVARAVGRSATAIYLHFEGKDGLVHALMDEGFEELRSRLAAAAGCEDPRERLVALGQAYVEFGLESPELYEIMFLLRTESLERYPAASYREARRGLEFFTSALDELDEGESTAPRDSHLAAATLWSFLHGGISLSLSHRLDTHLDEQAFLDSVVENAVSSVTPPYRQVGP